MWGCKNVVVGGELVWNYGAVLILFRIKLLLAPPTIVPKSKVLGLQLSQGRNHPRDEGLVPPLLHSLDRGLRPIINYEGHERWDAP